MSPLLLVDLRGSRKPYFALVLSDYIHAGGGTCIGADQVQHVWRVRNVTTDRYLAMIYQREVHAARRLQVARRQMAHRVEAGVGVAWRYRIDRFALWALPPTTPETP